MILQNWWYTTLLGLPKPIQPPLKTHLKADVLIVGGGAAGLSAAMTLVNRGLKIVLLEQNICGGSSTGKSAGFLTPDSELELEQLLRRYGKTRAKMLWDGATSGIQSMVNNIRKYGVDCDLQVQDSLFLGNTRSGWKGIQSEVEARKELDYPYEMYDQSRLPEVLGSTSYFGGVRYPGTFGINPLRYAQGIKQALLSEGVQIFEASEVKSLADHKVETHLGSVTADKIIFCIDKIKPTLSPYSANIFHAQTFLSISEPLDERDIEKMFPKGRFQCWDSDLVYTYYRLTGDHRLLVGGGDALTTFSKKDVTSPRVIKRVIEKFRKKYPFLEHVEFLQYWPGRIDTTRDLIPTVLHDEKTPWLHFVLGCVGLPWATFCGQLVAEHSFHDTGCSCHLYYDFFKVDRPFLLPLKLISVLGKQLTYSLNNMYSKYYQVDKG